ncbi:MAG: acid phosphatase [Mycobacteriaceae bacterium]
MAPDDSPARLVLLRHGETEWSRTGKHTGNTDVPLTTVGQEQAHDVRAVLARLDLREPVVFTSPRSRARDTARIAGLDVDEVTDDLVEWDYGDYDGLTTAQIRETVPGWTVWTHPCPGGETPSQVQARADAVLSRALAAGADVVLVGHGHMSRALLARWVGLPVTDGIHFSMSPAGVSVLGHEHDRRQIEAMNIVPVSR